MSRSSVDLVEPVLVLVLFTRTFEVKGQVVRVEDSVKLSIFQDHEFLVFVVVVAL